MTDNTRFILFAALGVILFLIWQAWERENAPAPVAITAPKTAGSTSGGDVPKAPSAPAATKTDTPAVTVIAKTKRVEIKTDLFKAVVDTQGADLRELYLLKYPVAADRPNEPFPLLRDEGTEIFIVQSGLIAAEGVRPNHNTRFEAGAERYELKDGQDKLVVPLTWKGPDGVRYTKYYIFHRGSYLIDVEFKVDNVAKTPWRGHLYNQFQRAHVATSGFFDVAPSYTGGAIYTPEKKYEKIALSDFADKTIRENVNGGWVAMLQHYFVGAFLATQDEKNDFYTKVQSTRGTLGFTQKAATEIAPGGSGVLKATLYLGPKEQKILETLPEGMDLTVDYGMLTLISAPLFWLLEWLNRFLGNWGWAIIVLTVLIKLVFYPLSAASYKSMAHMKKMAPRLQALKERHGDDRQKLNQAMMELYKTEKINPLGGCLPILIQIPVFIALYWVLLESVEMRQAPWVLWLTDLSSKDPYYVLPIIMGASMYAQQLMNPQPLDPVQQKIFALMPLFFTVFFLFFPAGLVLYWTVNNVLSIAQQWYINKTLGVATTK